MSHREEFNQKLKGFKKIDKGYKPPAGPVVSWNDIAWHFKMMVSNNDAKSAGGKRKNLERTDTLGVHLASAYNVYDTGGASLTKLGQFFETFSPYLKDAILDGRMALLQRGDFIPEKVSDIDLPKDLRTSSAAGYYLSSAELKRVIEECKIDGAPQDEDFNQGYGQFNEVMDTVLSKCTDYSAAQLTPVNRPIPQEKLRNTPVQRHRDATRSKFLNGGGRRECM
jgi:hypothetical protein